MIHSCGDSLIDEVNETTLDGGEFAFWWLGQHSFVVKIKDRILYLDPFLTDMPERRVRPLLEARQVCHADIIFGSHDHGDHIDRPAWPTLARVSPQAMFVVPELLRPRVVSELAIDADRVIGLNDGATIECHGIRITGVAAAHEMLDRDPQSGLYPCLGFILEADGLRVYHAGDTCRYEGLLGKLSGYTFDVAFLPINGRDAQRYQNNIVGNMTYQEAADLAGELEPRLVVPAHYDMFAGNLADPEAFRSYMAVKYPHIPTWCGEYGKRVTVHKRQ